MTSTMKVLCSRNKRNRFQLRNKIQFLYKFKRFDIHLLRFLIRYETEEYKNTRVVSKRISYHSFKKRISKNEINEYPKQELRTSIRFNDIKRLKMCYLMIRSTNDDMKNINRICLNAAVRYNRYSLMKFFKNKLNSNIDYEFHTNLLIHKNTSEIKLADSNIKIYFIKYYLKLEQYDVKEKEIFTIAKYSANYSLLKYTYKGNLVSKNMIESIIFYYQSLYMYKYAKKYFK